MLWGGRFTGMLHFNYVPVTTFPSTRITSPVHSHRIDS